MHLHEILEAKVMNIGVYNIFSLLRYVSEYELCCPRPLYV